MRRREFSWEVAGVLVVVVVDCLDLDFLDLRFLRRDSSEELLLLLLLLL